MNNKTVTIILSAIILIILVFMLIKFKPFKENYTDDLNSTINSLQNTLNDFQDKFQFAQNEHNLAALFTLAGNVVSCEYIELENIKMINYSPYEKNQYKLRKYKYKPVLHTNDKKTIWVMKFEKGCKKVDLTSPYKSSCIISIDTNDIKGPNEYKKDRYNLIFDGPNYKFRVIEGADFNINTF